MSLNDHDTPGTNIRRVSTNPCSKCQGKGYYEAYMGGMSDHDPVRIKCSCGLVPATAPVAPPEAKADVDLAKELRARSGAAYAQGDDARAIRLRNAADLIEGKVVGPYSLEPCGPVDV
jgi:hypothetical protein